MHFICCIFWHISLEIDESQMGKFVGIPQIKITMSKQYAGISGKYGNIYTIIQKPVKIGELVNFFKKILHNFHMKYLKNRFNTDTPKKTYNSTLKGEKKYIGRQTWSLVIHIDVDC